MDRLPGGLGGVRDVSRFAVALGAGGLGVVVHVAADLLLDRRTLTAA
jgi:hypothetical protein